MVLTIIFIASIGIVLPIMYFVMRFEGKPKETMLFGVTMKKEYYEDSRVEQIENAYKRELNGYSLVLLIVIIPVALIKYFSIVYTLTMAWLFATTILTILPFTRANGKLKRLKQENDWYVGGVQKEVPQFQSVRLSTPIKDNLFYVAAVAASILTIIGFAYLWGTSQITFDIFISTLCLTSTTFVLVAIGILFQRRKIKIRIDHDEFDRQSAKEKNRIWGRNIGCLSWINAIYSIAFLFIVSRKDKNIFLAIFISILYLILVVWMLVDAGMKMKQEEKKLRETYELKDLEEEDDHWIFGMIYYNKENKSTFVDTRVGSGYSFNMAKRGAKEIMVLVMITLLLLPISSAFMIADEFTPIKLVMAENELKVKRYKVDYSISKSEIKEIELLQTLPRLNKTNGTSMEHLKKGNFSCEEYGTVKACLDPMNTCFLLIKTDTHTYILSAAKDEDTRKIYKEIKQ